MERVLRAEGTDSVPEGAGSNTQGPGWADGHVCESQEAAASSRAREPGQVKEDEAQRGIAELIWLQESSFS